MTFLCENCDREILENPDEYQHYITASRKKNDKNLYTKCTTNNISFDELDKILKDYTSTHNKKFVFFP